jgi:hypothetical protein
MAMGIPVVSTSISCVGMNVTPIQDPHFASADDRDRDIVFADTPETFAQSVVNILQQPELRQKIGAAAIWHSQRYKGRTSQSRSRLGKLAKQN